MKITALNPCRKHAWFLVGIVTIAVMTITSCKKDQAIAPGALNDQDTTKTSGLVINSNSSASRSTGGKPTKSGTTTTTPTTTTTTPTTTTTTPTTTAPAPGGTYTASPAIALTGKHDIVISWISTPSISLTNCYNITIKHCNIGPSTTVGIPLYQCTNISIDSCNISNVSTGVYAVLSQTVSVTNCQAKNMMGPYPRGEFVQFNQVSGGGNHIMNNKFENILGQSYTQDAINIYQSNGLASDPIMISGNWIRGGGPSNTGSGIMLGDGGGSNIVAQNNILVDPGQCGMAIAGGTNVSIINNSIYAQQQSFTNVGIYYWNQSGLPSSAITISGNKINFTNSNGVLNNTWLPSGSLVPTGWNTNVYSTTLSESLLPAALTSL
jgi:hypothetical protein